MATNSEREAWIQEAAVWRRKVLATYTKEELWDIGCLSQQGVARLPWPDAERYSEFIQKRLPREWVEGPAEFFEELLEQKLEQELTAERAMTKRA